MESLQEYFQGAFQDEKREIKNISKLVNDIWPVFSHSYMEKGWPYEIEDNKGLTPPEDFSYSTNSMILYAMALALGIIRNGYLHPVIDTHFESIGLSIDTMFEATFATALNQIMERCKISYHKSKRNKVLTRSGSYGDNDPFTLTWLYEIVISRNFVKHHAVESIIEEKRETFKKNLMERAIVSIKRVFENPEHTLLVKHSFSDHMFPLLRTIQLFCNVDKHKDHLGNRDIETLEKIRITLNKKIQPYLIGRVHQHLSLFSIPNSSFDAAELVFSLEGLLLADDKRHSVDRYLLHRIFDVIKESQARSPYWRPLKPFATTSRGYALLPLSVEIANSLLRICKILETKGDQEYFFSRYLELFRQYTNWLLTRVTRGKFIKLPEAAPVEFTGWHSEHIYAPQKIHPWETVQVLIYLSAYGPMMQEHIARNSLSKARLSIEKLHKEEISSPPESYWREFQEKKEPLHGLTNNESSFKVYSRIREFYIKPRGNTERSGEPHYSMLLYGPPGTGKTSVAEELAKSLDWRLITITPSDFITRGEAEVEARTKAIFRTLVEQDNVIILFDEIDRLILDRDSNLYLKQSDIFQFMTPSMLVKLKGLRDRKGSIFIISTNYEERIDAAIKRIGRIDDRFLIAPPDIEQRLSILKDQLTKKLKKRTSISTDRLESVCKVVEDIHHGSFKVNEILSSTALATFKELEQLAIISIDNYLDTHSDTDDTKSFMDVLLQTWESQEPPAIRLTAYENRFRNLSSRNGEDKVDVEKDFPVSQEPFMEFLTLAYIKYESCEENPTKGFKKEEIDLIHKVARSLTSSAIIDQNRIVEELKRLIKDTQIQNKLIEMFKNLPNKVEKSDE